MEALATESTLTGRVERLELTANSYEDERILRSIMEAVASGDTLFEMSRDGQPCGNFTFQKRAEKQEDA